MTASQGPDPVTTLVVDAPGGRVWAQVWGDTPRTPLVTLHGGPGSPHDYLEPLGALADERPVVFYDQLGCGASERPADASLWVTERFVEELRCVLDAVGRAPVHLLGHSWGAMLAVDFALAYRARVASLVLASPCLSMRRVREDMGRLKATLPEAVRAVIERHEREGTTDAGAYGAAAMVFYRTYVCRRVPWPEPLERSQANWGWDVYRTMWGAAEFSITGNLAHYEREERLAELTMPVLYLCGRHDEITPESTAAYHARTPRSEMVVFENSAHVAHLEETEKYLAVVRDFIRRAEGVQP